MTTRAELAPLFTNIALSADDVSAIAAALHDVAASDGEHAEEVEMINGLLASLDADLGAAQPTPMPDMSPAKLALTLSDPTTRKLAVQCAVLLAWADGTFTDKERACILGYAGALGFSRPDYDAIEKLITSWVKSGDAAPLF